MLGRRKTILAVVLLFSVQSLSVNAKENIGQTRQPLNVAATTIWSGAIPVCWETNGFNADKLIVRTAISQTWEKESAVRFTGWGACGSSPNSGIRIRINDEGPHTKGLGNRLNGIAAGMVLNFTFNSWSTGCASASARTSCIRSIAVHEFGHAMGFTHEQNRPDTICETPPQGADGDTIVGAWDLSSVMNYCNPAWNNNGFLSDSDIEGARIYYGVPQSLKVSTPNGPYSRTCSDIFADGKRLYATCRDKTDRLWKTSLSNYGLCSGDINNLDGYLGCSSVPSPNGSYRSACRDIVINDQILSATCKAISGSWRKTSLAEFKSCSSDISNSNGTLSCLKNNPPNGSYRQTCRDIIADGNFLYATCKDTAGNWRDRTYITDFKLCIGDIGNANGNLTCNKP